MSMTQMALLQKADMPTNGQIQDFIQKLGYDFEILNELEKQIDRFGLECIINGNQTFIETYVDNPENAIDEDDWDNIGITNQDTAVLFTWSSDFAAAACIGLITTALVDLSNALIYSADDQVISTREMIIDDTNQFIAELSK